MSESSAWPCTVLLPLPTRSTKHLIDIQYVACLKTNINISIKHSTAQTGTAALPQLTQPVSVLHPII